MCGYYAGIRIDAGDCLVRADIGDNALVPGIEYARKTAVYSVVVKDQFAQVYADPVRLRQHGHLASCGLIVECLHRHGSGSHFMGGDQARIGVNVGDLGIAAGVSDLAHRSAWELGRKLIGLHFRDRNAGGVKTHTAGSAVTIDLDLEHYAVVGFYSYNGIPYNFARDEPGAVDRDVFGLGRSESQVAARFLSVRVVKLELPGIPLAHRYGSHAVNLLDPYRRACHMYGVLGGVILACC